MIKIEIITSLENEKVKYWNKLHQKKYRDQENLFIVEGLHLVNEAIKSGFAKELILESDYEFTTNLPKHIVTKEIMAKLSSLESPSKIIAICHKLKKKELGDNILILNNIQDPGNLGTIIRSALAFNFKTIILSPDSVDIYNEKVIRSSQGMLFYLNIIITELKTYIPALKAKNYQIYGTKVDGGTNIKELPKSIKYALIMGNEGQGINNELLNLCDEHLYIPMNETCESLNVAIAASIIMYELVNK